MRMRVMAAPRKYSDELRERATRMAVEARQDPATRAGALARAAGQLGINPETLWNWVDQAESTAGPAGHDDRGGAADRRARAGGPGAAPARTRSSKLRRRFSPRRSSTAD